MPTAGCINHNDFTAFIGQVEEGVGDFGGQIGKVALVEVENRVANANFEAPLQHMDGFFLEMMHMQWRAAMWSHLNDKIVKRAVGILARDLENQVAPRPGLQPQTLTLLVNNVLADHVA